MSNQKKNPNILIAEKQIIQSIPSLSAIYLFGSYGSNYQRKDSDIDLAILTKEEIEILSLWEIAQNISLEIKIDVDLIDLRKASTVFCFQILTEGKRIYAPNPSYSDKFETVALSMYLNLNEERKEILEDQKKWTM